jgi:hypothetical protein
MSHAFSKKEKMMAMRLALSVGNIIGLMFDDVLFKLILSFGWMFVFCLKLVCDLQMMIGGRRENESMEDTMYTSWKMFFNLSQVFQRLLAILHLFNETFNYPSWL